VAVAGAVMTCVAAPPSDHEPKVQVVPLRTCGEVAVTVFDEPTITVLVNWVVDADWPTTSDRPVGAELKVRLTVCGSSRRVTDAEVPRLSVAVSVSSRYDG
jgi:hypothetical protein